MSVHFGEFVINCCPKTVVFHFINSADGRGAIRKIRSAILYRQALRRQFITKSTGFSTIYFVSAVAGFCIINSLIQAHENIATTSGLAGDNRIIIWQKRIKRE